MINNKKTLTAAEKKELRGYAQNLKVLIHVGKQGVTPTLIKELEICFHKNELVKVKFLATRDALKEQAKALEEATNSICVGGVGHTQNFYRKMPKSRAEELEKTSVRSHRKPSSK